MGILGPILALILGVLLVTIWAVNTVLVIIGWVIIVAAAVVIVKYLLGNRSRTDL